MACRPIREWAAAQTECLLDQQPPAQTQSGQAKQRSQLESRESLPKNFQVETRWEQDQRTECRALPPASEEELRQQTPLSQRAAELADLDVLRRLQSAVDEERPEVKWVCPKPFIVWEGCGCSSTSTTIVGAGRDRGSCGRGGTTGEAAGRASGPETDVDLGRASAGERRSVGRSLRRSRSAGGRKHGSTTSRSGTSPRSSAARGGQRGGVWGRTSSR